MSDLLFERAVRDWLDDGSDRTPPAALEAVLLAVKTTPQERVLRIPRRFSDMPSYMRLAAVAAVIAVVGFGALTYLGIDPRAGSPTPPPTPTLAPTAPPTPGPTVLGPIDTADWVTYVSDRYGFTIKHPPNWIDELADHDWTWASDFEAWTSTGTESFSTPDAGGVKFSAWSVAIAPGSTAEDAMETWCTATSDGSCAAFLAAAVPVETGDGHSGLGQFGNTDTMAFFVEGDVLYVAAIWRWETDSSVLAYGGARRLLEGYLSTLTLTPDPRVSPDAS